MFKEFEFLSKDVRDEVILLNPSKINDMVDEILPIPNGTFPPKIEGSDDEIRMMAYEKAHSIYGENLHQIIKDRLDKELNSIISNGYAVLYLIAHKHFVE